MKRKISSLAIMFMSMALTLHLTDQVVRHSQEVAPNERTQVAERCSGYVDAFALPSGGLGAMIECEPSGVRLVTCLPGHAGLTSGLRLGDRIISIDGESTRGCDEAWAIEHLRGKIGTKVDLEVERGQGIWARTFRTTIERKNIETEYSVYSRLRDKELTVRVLWLGSETTQQLVNHLSQDGDIDRVVLDLTHLSRGDIHNLQRTASVFLPEGTALGSYGTSQSENLTPLNSVGHQFTDKLDAVLVGPYTAREGEVLARALRDQMGIEVEGEATAGLGTLDRRTIRSRAQDSESAARLFDVHGQQIEGNPLKPQFWSWSTLLSPVGSGLE